MVAPIVGWGVCVCGAPVAHRKGCPLTLDCSYTCRTRRWMVERPEQYAHYLERKKTKRRIRSMTRLAVLAVDNRAILEQIR